MSIFERTAAVPERLADKAASIDKDRRRAPHALRLVALHESTTPVAA